MNDAMSKAKSRWRMRETERLGEFVREEIRLAKLQAAQAREELIAMLPAKNARRLRRDVSETRPESDLLAADARRELIPLEKDYVENNVIDFAAHRRRKQRGDRPERAQSVDPSTRFAIHAERAELLMRRLWPDSYPEASEPTVGPLERARAAFSKVLDMQSNEANVPRVSATSDKTRATMRPNERPLEEALQRFVGKTISQVEFDTDAGLVELTFTDGARLPLPIAALRKLSESNG